MYRAHTVSVAAAVDPGKAYAYASDPGNLPAWAPGFVKSIEKRGDAWVAQTTVGQARFRFAPTNTFGVLDHEVELPSGTFHNPMRVIPNGSGCEILFTVLQLPGMTDEQFKDDLETIRDDLKRLRTVLEQTFASATSNR
jgi:Polyketide cyclase / dehydrase and lipid transport